MRKTIAFIFDTLVTILLLNYASEAAADQSSTNDPRPNILFCLADDWAWPHAGVYGDKVVKTPNFDRIAREGVLFTHTFSAAPSCTPSRAAMLTGQGPHRLKEGGNLWGFLPREFPVYPNLLEKSGYTIGFTGKGWAPGNFQAGERTRNPAGNNFKNFDEFLKKLPDGKPFCFWFGSHQPHRPYEKGAGVKSGMDPKNVVVPPYLPDTPEVRSDILDYYTEVQQFDRDLGNHLKLLEAAGKLDNTLIVVSGDNGWPFPRGKANVYDAGSRQPFAIRWAAKLKGGKTSDAFVNLADLAPTFLEVAGLKPLPEMTGKSLLALLTGKEKSDERDAVFLERERHANARKGDLSYPVRAIRTKDFLYVRNLRPDRWPAGDPEMWKAVGPFGDCDASPTKDFILDHRDNPKFKKYFQLAFAKRPAEELYDLKKDPHQINNVADRKDYSTAKKKLRTALDKWLVETADPRFTQDDDRWDKYPYFGAAPK